MKERFLAPIRETHSDYEALRVAIVALLKRELYFPLLKQLGRKPTALHNALASLIDAILSGEIKWDGKGFVGAFTSKSSKELRELGAKFDRSQARWEIAQDKLSSDVQQAIGIAERKEQAIKRQLDEALSALSPDDIAQKLHTDNLFQSTAANIDSQFKESIKRVMIAPAMSPEAKRRLAAEYSENLKLYVRDFTGEQIKALREQVAEHVFAGRRYEGLVKHLQDSFGIAQRKAHFLARQETILLSSKIRETRYADAGIDDYEWQCVTGTAEHPVRPYHLALNGTRQKFSAPPITDKDGRRNNPGEDFNCRCVARPILKF